MPSSSQRASQRSIVATAAARPPVSPPSQRITSGSATNSSTSGASSSRGLRSTSRSVSIKRDHDRALELDHDLIALIDAAGPDGRDPPPGARLRLALRQDLRLGVQRVPGEHRRRQPHFAPTQIHAPLGDVDHRKARHKRERERRVHERLLPLGRRCILRIEVDRVRVQRHQREPDVVCLQHRPPEAAPVDRAHLQLVIGHVRNDLIDVNRLAQETSPYLLQHAANPVDWYPWGDDAFARARAEDKPVLLSVGYSACHWCHVMERESFEDAETARLMNEHYVSVKVDREERPDVDAVYMDAVVTLSGHGGWPMTVFLLPSGEPFFGGTYYPPEPRHGLPAFRQVLIAIDEAYRTQREDVEKQAQALVDALGRTAQLQPSTEPLTADA